MNISPGAPAYARSEITIAATPEVVWRRLTDFAAWREWNPDIQAMSFAGPVVPGATFTWKTGGIQIRSTIEEVEDRRVIAWSGKALGTRAMHAWTLIPEGTGTKVSTEESFDGWLVRLMPRAMQKTLDKGLASQLSYLKLVAEKAS